MVRKGLSLDSFIWAFSTLEVGNYHPLTWISHMLDVELYGLNSGHHHLTNVFFHIANTLLLFNFLNASSSMPLRSGLVACLFALHPTHIESVAWVAERKDVLCAFFFLLSLRCYLSYVKFPSVARYCAVFLCYILSLGAKPMAVTLPFVLLLLDFWPLARCNQFTASVENRRFISLSVVLSLKQIIFEKIPLLIPTIGSAFLTFKAQESAGYVRSLTSFPLYVRLENSIYSYWLYVCKTFFPVKLAILYPYPDAIPTEHLLLAILALGGLTVFFAKLIRNRPYYMIGWLWFLGTLVPAIGIIQVGYHAMADRFTYLPAIGLYIIIAWGLGDIMESSSGYKKLYTSISVCIAAALSILSWNQLQYWRDSIALYQRSLQVTANNYYLHTILGATFVERQRYVEAIGEFEAALRIKTNYVDAYKRLCVPLALTGRNDEAQTCFKKTIAMEPEDPSVHYNFGNFLLENGDMRASIEHFQTAIRLAPSSPLFYNRLGEVWLQLGERDKAADLFQAALKANPNFNPAQRNLQRMKNEVDGLDTKKSELKI
ncbi:MAG: tetratricopeptide repeat protein [Desulfobulbaceae bacterium]|nr:tetratricopeptide repeat protein [Desulfobulbaceae bacterium]